MIKTNIIITTEVFKINVLTFIPFIPRIGEKMNLQDILLVDEIKNLQNSSKNWDGVKGTIKSVEYRHDDYEFYVELIVFCNN